MNDKITLQNMVFYGFHGVYPHESQYGQRFHCDVELYGNFTRASETDDLTHAVDYTKVYNTVREIMENRQFKLLEALAGCIAKLLMENYPIQGIAVRIRKPACPLPGALDYTQVEITRGRTQ